jgi:hypothetical protein
MSQLKIPKKYREFIDSISSKITTDSSVYYYMPFWFKTTNKKNVFEVCTFEYLPKDLKNYIKQERNNEKET